MPATYEELIVESARTVVGGGDSPGSTKVRGTIRRFKVPGETPALAALYPQLILDAGAGVPHPTIPGLVSIGYSVGQRGGAGDDTYYYVDAEYAPEGTALFDFPPPDRQRLGLVSAGFQQYEKEINFPIYSRQTIAAPSSGGQVDTWVQVENKSIRVKGCAFTIEFNTMTLGPPQLDAIFNQMNNIHQLFPGGGWLFKPQRADKIFRDGTWNVVYRWEGERGTGPDELASIRADPNYCPVANRAPHAEWFVVWKDFGVFGKVPHLEAHNMHPTVDLGYQVLPGYGTEWNL